MKVYLDNAATTPIDNEVFEAMMPIIKDGFGNPSSTHFYGRKIKSLIERARKNVARHMNCSPGEIFFTSGEPKLIIWLFDAQLKIWGLSIL